MVTEIAAEHLWQLATEATLTITLQLADRHFTCPQRRAPSTPFPTHLPSATSTATPV
jgi:hypothetical protein